MAQSSFDSVLVNIEVFYVQFVFSFISQITGFYFYFALYFTNKVT